jgi:hypothetical protein
LFGFEDEAAPFVEVDAPGRGGAIGMMLGDREFEGVPEGVGGIWMGHAEEVAQFGKAGCWRVPKVWPGTTWR